MSEPIDLLNEAAWQGQSSFTPRPHDEELEGITDAQFMTALSGRQARFDGLLDQLSAALPSGQLAAVLPLADEVQRVFAECVSQDLVCEPAPSKWFHTCDLPDMTVFFFFSQARATLGLSWPPDSKIPGIARA